MRKRMIGHRRMARGYRDGPRTHGRPYGPPVPPPFFAFAALLAAFAVGRASGARRRFKDGWGPSTRGCAGPPRGTAGRGPGRGEEPPVIV